MKRGFPLDSPAAWDSVDAAIRSHAQNFIVPKVLARRAPTFELVILVIGNWGGIPRYRNRSKDRNCIPTHREKIGPEPDCPANRGTVWLPKFRPFTKETRQTNTCRGVSHVVQLLRFCAFAL